MVLTKGGRVELKRRPDFRIITTVIYIVAGILYIVVGLVPAGAKSYEISGSLEIPALDLSSDVTTLKLENGKLETPDTLVGSYSRFSSKVFLVGHSTTVFQNLKRISISDEVIYNHETYKVTDLKVLAKTEIKMRELYAATEVPTLVIMTCAGEGLSGGDATHRLIVTAEKV